jgi:hypothetical protein
MARSLQDTNVPSAKTRHMITVLSRIATSDLQALSNFGGKGVERCFGGASDGWLNGRRSLSSPAPDLGLLPTSVRGGSLTGVVVAEAQSHPQSHPQSLSRANISSTVFATPTWSSGCTRIPRLYCYYPARKTAPAHLMKTLSRNRS